FRGGGFCIVFWVTFRIAAYCPAVGWSVFSTLRTVTSALRSPMWTKSPLSLSLSAFPFSSPATAEASRTTSANRAASAARERTSGMEHPPGRPWRCRSGRPSQALCPTAARTASPGYQGGISLPHHRLTAQRLDHVEQLRHPLRRRRPGGRVAV